MSHIKGSPSTYATDIHDKSIVAAKHFHTAYWKEKRLALLERALRWSPTSTIATLSGSHRQHTSMLLLKYRGARRILARYYLAPTGEVIYRRYGSRAAWFMTQNGYPMP